MKQEYEQEDDAQLAAMGHQPELKRNFSTLSMLGLAFAVLNSWTALSASLSISLTSGGSTSVVWGLVTAGVCNLCIAASLAEFLSAYPTAGGQYHWVAVSRLASHMAGKVDHAVSWPKWVPILSWVTGWINVAGWIALVATNALLSSQLIVGVISALHPSYEPQRWHQFLIYIGLTLLSFVINAFMNSLLPLIYKGAFMWSIGGFVVVSITVLACASPDYNSAYFVFCDFINQTGWPDGIAWLLGLLQGGLGVTAFDAVAHMIEEIPGASSEGPKIMIVCVGIGTFTGAIFLIVLLFVSGNIDDVIKSAAGPLLQILIHATKSNAGGICLLMLPLVCLVFATLSVMTTSSRMIFAFARDGGLPASRFFAKVHPRLGLPVNALLLTSGVVVVFGLIFLGSTRYVLIRGGDLDKVNASSAFNAIIAGSVVALDLSYAMPIAVNCLRGRNTLPERKWRLPSWLGWTADTISLAYISLTTVLFLFPPGLPVTGTNMNYCVVAFAIIVIISVFQWIVDGRKNFTGPRVNLVAAETHED
ncbi:amino acid permease [Purpureocillium lavendulum]|uniref:Amino acid permease n=1 Tax=Purpureocillium lavendulum TaxID=1247861 RepID=A0AB34FNZ8_9HYPO|nr:amino acid permease [Purpureocillium lavendulum]